ncbi:MAG TPA: phosphatase PAP2 family protein [Flavisolibacter sp.]
MRIHIFTAFLVAGMLASLPASAQKPSELLFISADAKAKLPPAPAGKTYQEELAIVKQRTATADARSLQAVRYWDAGAPAYRWNEIGYKLTGPQLFNTPDGGNFWRSPMAWMNIAIYNASLQCSNLQQKHGVKRPYELDPSIRVTARKPASSSFPCTHSATAAAAGTVLAYFFPQQSDSLLELARQAAASRIDGGVQFPADVAAGWKIGEDIAREVIRRSETHAMPVTVTPASVRNTQQLWQGSHPVGMKAGTLKPLVLRSGDQFRPAPPPLFDAEMEQLKKLEQNFFTRYLAYKWAGLSGLDIWTDLAAQKIFEYNLQDDALKAAAIYALLHVTVHDATIAIMDAKYAYRGIRPDQLDPVFKPLLGFTPPFPGYPSGHATASAAAATVLAHFFPDDAPAFHQLARECAESRFFAGIHFPTDNNVGIEMGNKLAGYVIQNWPGR